MFLPFLLQVSLNLMDDEQGSNTMSVEKKEIAQLVKCRMASLGLPLEDYGEYKAPLLPCGMHSLLHQKHDMTFMILMFCFSETLSDKRNTYDIVMLWLWWSDLYMFNMTLMFEYSLDVMTFMSRVQMTLVIRDSIPQLLPSWCYDLDGLTAVYVMNLMLWPLCFNFRWRQW